MKKLVTAFIAFAALATQSVAEMVPNSEFSYQSWKGAAYTDDATGEFSHCAISASYKSGDNLFFSVNRDATVTIGVSGNLGLRKGEEFPVALYVDRRAPFYGNAVALDSQFAALNLENFEAAMTAFKKGFYLRIEARGGYSEYSLKGTFRALDAALKCAYDNYNYKAAVSVPTKDKTALFQLSTMVLGELGISDFRYLSENELRDLNLAHASSWEAPSYGMFGSFLSVPYNGSQSIRETDASDTQFMAGGVTDFLVLLHLGLMANKAVSNAMLVHFRSWRLRSPEN